MFTDPPDPPYYAVVFSSQRHDGHEPEYAEAAQRMLELAAAQPGFLGVDSTRGADGFGITVSYWRDEASIKAWREHPLHTPVQQAGRQRWYQRYEVHVAKVERSYGFPDPAGAGR
jgi:heme-degrading monooxygenase HmoA